MLFFLILFLNTLISIISYSDNDNYTIPYSLYNNTIKINTYKSNISNEQLIELRDWISIRNAFFYSYKDIKLAKEEIYFNVDKETYFDEMKAFGTPFFICCFLSIFFILIYLIMRFLFKKCTGPKKIENSYVSQTKFIFVIGFLISYYCIINQAYYFINANSSINKVIDFVEKQNIEMIKIYSETLNYMKIIQKTEIKNEKGEILNYIKEIYMEDSITKDINKISEKMKNFINDIKKTQIKKFIYQIIYLILLPILTTIGILGVFLRRNYLPWLSSFILFITTSFLFYFLGIEIIFSFIGIEFCQNINNSITTGIIPSGNKCLGNYISCSSKDAQKKIHTAIYELNESFNIIYNFLYEEIKKFNNSDIDLYNLNYKKREEETYKKIKEKYSKNGIFESCDNLIYFNFVLSGLLSLSNCRTSKNNINYIEENFCSNGIHYMINNVYYGFFVCIGVFILSIAINKFITIMRKIAETALRGKGEFNDDILDDDENNENFSGIIN